MVYTDGVIVSMCPCVLLAASSVVHYLVNVDCSFVCIYCVSMWILYRYSCICVPICIILYQYIHHMILQDVSSV